ncbi:hypothetical protein MMC18_009607 [Xylographa bjoerkii]|nr:hypothetical protein [Xylographa bjoerkii]
MEPYHELDPLGDIVLILSTNSLVPDVEPLIDDNAVCVDAHDFSTTTSLPDDEGQEVPVQVSSSSTTTSLPDFDGGQEVRIRVSSKHLTLASRVFKNMLKPGFLEGDKLHDPGYVEFLLPDDNPAALLILLNLVHGRIRTVPRKVDIVTLLELAILVDKYELLEITEMILDFWLENPKKKIKEGFDEDLIPWMCISYVFRKPEIFRQVTKTAQLESEGPIDNYSLPIPVPVLSG